MGYAFSSEVEKWLLREGWRPGRRVDVSVWESLFEGEGLTMHLAARSFLGEFGGLILDVEGYGVNSTKYPSQFDPSLCAGDGQFFLQWSEEIGRQVYPIGHYDEGRFSLGMDAESEILMMEGWVASFGPMPAAIEHMILGVKPDSVSE